MISHIPPLPTAGIFCSVTIAIASLGDELPLH